MVFHTVNCGVLNTDLRYLHLVFLRGLQKINLLNNVFSRVKSIKFFEMRCFIIFSGIISLSFYKNGIFWKQFSILYRGSISR
jgi:hypothetical protein